jgi:Kef-type K+ transport system membrane component KefB
MLTYTLLIILSSLVIFSYLFDMIARRTKLPSVLLLLFSGILIRFGVDYFHIPSFNFLNILPALGSIGLILIVLEGSLELKYERKKNKVILQSFLSALIILLATITAIGYIFYLASGASWNQCVVNAIPYSIISSAIAIPSVANLTAHKKEFVIYESSFSDIIGIVVFNFFIYNETISLSSFAILAWDSILIIIVSVIFCLLLLFIIGRIKHQVKFFLVISIIVLVYGAGKILHLPSLIIVLAFGLFLNNASQIRNHIFQKYFIYPDFHIDLNQLYRMSAESAFLVRTFFFIIFGFIIELDLLKNLLVIKTGLYILIIVYIIRGIYLKFIGKIPLVPEIFISPRGLISILLFISIPEKYFLPEAGTGLLFLVVLSSSLIMSVGLLVRKSKSPAKENGIY